MKTASAEQFFKEKFGNELRAMDSWVIRFAQEYHEHANKLENPIELLEESDELLAKIEDFMKGEEGIEITRLRGKIDNFLYKK